mgnify:CR=1 FL=1
MSGLMSGALRQYLAFDYGLKRVGVATGNSVSRQAQPLGPGAQRRRGTRFCGP